MNKSSLIDSVHERNAHTSKEDVQDSINEILDYISESLSLGNRVELRGFGSFSTRKRSKRIARNPKTGTSIQVNKKYHPYFRTSKSLKEIIKY